MDMQGKNINDLFGQIKFKKLKCNDDNDYFFDDFLIVSKFDSSGIRNIKFDFLKSFRVILVEILN